MRRAVELWLKLVEFEDGLRYILLGFVLYVIGVGLDIFFKVDPFNWIP